MLKRVELIPCDRRQAQAPRLDDYFVASFILIYPYFGWLLDNRFVAMLAIGGVLLTVHEIIKTFRQRDRIGIDKILWLLFLEVVALGLVRSEEINTSTLYFCFLVILLVLAGQQESFFWALVYVATAFALIHAIATILFYAIPQIYLTVKASFPALATSQDAVGYTSGLTTHYSFNGMILASGFIFSASLFLYRTSFISKLRRNLSGLTSLLLLLALILTTKRAVLVFSVFSVALVYVVTSRMRLLAALRLFFLVLLAALTVTYIVPSLQSGINESFSRLSDVSFSDTVSLTTGRVYLWQHAIEMWRSNPLFGHGWSTFSYQWVDTRFGEVSSGAHNVYLQLLAETGIVGFILFISIQIRSFSISIRAIRQSELDLPLLERTQSVSSSSASALFTASISFQVFFALYCFTGNPLYDVENYTPFLIAVGSSIQAVSRYKYPTSLSMAVE